MKASFDGARRNLAHAYNDVARTIKDEPVLTEEDLRSAMNSLQAAVGGLLCMYDPDVEGDANEIDINLITVGEND